MNQHLARLDRQIRLHGESVQIIRAVGTTNQTKMRANIRSVVKTLGIEQLVGAVSTTNYIILISPTDLRRTGWPGAVASTIPSGTQSVRDPVVPSALDTVVIRGGTKTITRVDAIMDGDEVVRIELYVNG